MFDAFFVDYHNGNEKTYHMFQIEKQVDGFDWRDFIGNIRGYFSGCTSKEFQQGLQESGIYFICRAVYSEERFNSYTSSEWNRSHHTVLEHNNVGNY